MTTTPAPQPSQTPAGTESKLDHSNYVELELNDVHFCSHPDAFHVDVVSTEGTLPVTISLESHRTKGKWSCHVVDLKTHATKDAHKLTDGFAVVLALQHALLALQVEDNATPLQAKVDLKHHSASGAMHLLLVINRNAVDVDQAVPLGFHFELVPHATAPTDDALDAKMLELVKDMDRMMKVPEPMLLLLSQGCPKLLGGTMLCSWTVHPSLEPQFFALSEDATEIVFLKKGGYHIQIRGLSSVTPDAPATPSLHSFGAGSSLIASMFELYVDHIQVAMSQGYGNFCQLSYVLTVERTTVVSVAARGYHEIHRNVTLLIEQVPSM
ncbi:hypothetical protein H310_11733 [Aphanomyces invadans]|uniref:Uncharacterized protein n=1 Tax=Aphanomyces invadans TaxID=157072 RepID=A0A024TN36_9STRA|nr:hypothetical protein H310_11733 [Aphanomyces invadans]ETV94777.1 hypothetical protein H310_11733 [Aphanomyces invadans]|eukprot:XP_008876722.1 hypothetical protein H310_11733 [Aphanomyces invadans]